MFTPNLVIPILQVAVAAVTVLLAASLVALAVGRKDWHGRLNVLFFILTVTAVLGLELIIRFLNPNFTSSFTPAQLESLYVHLWFSIPAAIVLPFMLFSGKTHRSWHVGLSFVFSTLWVGTFVTGIFYLPSSFPNP